jgi:chromosome partitioning protein
MAEVFAVANQKGGVGKTTTAITLAQALTLHGRRVLVVDLDPQGHVATALGVQKADGLFRLLVDHEPLPAVVCPARPGLAIVPGNKRTEGAKRYLTTLDFRERALADALRDADFDVVILDCAPSFDVLHIAALAASDRLIIPTRLDHLAIDGVNELLASVGQIRQLGGRVALAGVVPTFFDRQTRETAEQMRALAEAFGHHVWPPIPQDTRAREAPAYGRTLLEYAPRSAAVIGYLSDHATRIGGYLAALARLLEVLG